MNLFYKDLSNSFIYHLIGLILNFIIYIVIARTIGINDFGEWNTARSIIELVIILSLLGNLKGLLRNAARDKASAVKNYKKILVQSIILFFLITPIVFYLYTDFGKELSGIIVVIAIGYGMFSLSNRLSESVLRAFSLNYLSIKARRIINPLTKFILLISIFYFISDSKIVLLSIAFAELLTFIFLIYYISSKIGTPFYRIKKALNSINKPSGNIFFLLNDLSKVALPYINISLVSLYLINSDIGGYSAAFRMSEMVMFFTMLFVSFSPIIVKLIKDKKIRALEHSYLSISKLLLVVTFPVLLFFIFLGTEILSLFGDSFSEYYNVLVILLFGVYFDAITGPVGQILNMSGREQYEMYVNIGILFLNLLLIFLFVPVYGVIGAAFSFAISRALGNIFKLIIVYRKLNINTFSLKHFLILLYQLLLILPVVFFLFEIILIYKVMFFLLLVLIYILPLFYLNFISKKEILFLKKI